MNNKNERDKKLDELMRDITSKDAVNKVGSPGVLGPFPCSNEKPILNNPYYLTGYIKNYTNIRKAQLLEKTYICPNCGRKIGEIENERYYSRIIGRTLPICVSCREKIDQNFITRWLYKIFGEWGYG